MMYTYEQFMNMYNDDNTKLNHLYNVFKSLSYNDQKKVAHLINMEPTKQPSDLDTMINDVSEQLFGSGFDSLNRTDKDKVLDNIIFEEGATEEELSPYRIGRRGGLSDIEWDELDGYENSSDYPTQERFRRVFEEITGHNSDDYDFELDDYSAEQILNKLRMGRKGSGHLCDCPECSVSAKGSRPENLKEISQNIVSGTNRKI